MRVLSSPAWILVVVTACALTTTAAQARPGKQKAAVEQSSSRSKAASGADKPGRARSLVRDATQRLRGARQHKYMPLRPGQTRVVEATSSYGGQNYKTVQTERVGEVRRENGTLRAQVESTWQGRFGDQTTSSKTSHVVDVGRRGIGLSFAERLDSPARADIKTSGVGLPRGLRVGKQWSNRMSSNKDGYRTTWESTSRVTGKVRHRGNDGKRRPGFVIESVTHTNTTTPDGQKHRSTTRTRSVHVKGLGEVESVTTTDGQQGTMLRRLVDVR
jgi:hypothetical protein